MPYLYEKIKREYKALGQANFCRMFCEALLPGEGGRPPAIDHRRLSLLALAEEMCGHEWVRRLQPDLLRQSYVQPLREAEGDAVDVSGFSNITGQIIYSAIHQGWEQDGMIGDQLFTTVPTRFDGEKIPGIGLVDKTGYRIHPGMPYPYVGLSEHYWNTPSILKHGMAIGVTKEAIYFDQTGLVLDRAQGISEQLRYNKEMRQLAVFAGITITLDPDESFNGNNHIWNGTSYNTYATTANAIGINSKASTVFTDWTSVDAADQLFNGLTNPDSGLPILVMGDTLVTMPVKNKQAIRVQRATTVQTTFPSMGTSGSASPGNVRFESANPVTIKNVLTSRLLRQLVIASGVSAANADDWWFWGQPKKAFKYMENWPLTMVQAPPGNEADFERDVVARFKVSERGQPWSADPRYNLKLYNA